MSETQMRVAVIGAGVAGLCALRHLLNSKKDYIPTCFERGSDVGGLWLYDRNTHIDDNGMPVFTSIYRDLIHHEKMNTPDIEGIEEFQGEVFHSHHYRTPENYKDKNVVVLGASFSGQDIAVGMSDYAKQVFLSHLKDTLKTALPANVVQKTGIKRMKKNRVVFLDDTEEEVDVLVFCTGFLTQFPFLSEDITQVNSERVTPLYTHIVHIKFTTLLFVGIPRLLSFFPQCFEIAKVVVAILDGTVALPSEDQMREDAENDFADRKREGLDDTQTHFMGDGDRQWRFNKDVAKMAGLDPLPTSFQRLWDYVTIQRDTKFLTFRKQNFEITDTETFVEIN
ncbi:flavin-containing monooxygenase FMO GS-OX-like 2 [Pecten maximus]|uniref:flavin-containing monooxygenase FMO GS-OX-like 2 n=1 Tax=Pecten maximus TaxID=6579 RepID=UPI0014590BB9|nr:flavin-containing monooxygenase FMO GS-OX-like 2 [Pecten maximus]